MNILFLFAPPINPRRGGVESVTFVLANYFEKRGNNVFFLSRFDVAEDPSNDIRQFFVPNKTAFNTIENKIFFKNFLQEHKIDILVNQFAISFDSFSFVEIAREMNIKIISAIHNSPLASVLNFTSSKFNLFERYKLKFLIPFFNSHLGKSLLKFVYKLRYANLYRRVLIYSDRLFLLSDKYMDQLHFFVKEKYTKKVICMPNPIPFEPVGIELSKKEKNILFVSRMLYDQKRPDFILYIWKKLQDEHKDWRLIVLGDGPYFEAFKNLARDLALINIEVKGFQPPLEYYKKAKIFCMTSTYEGFPMVLNESMQYATVPMAFNSFASLTDIIDDGINGYVISPFDLDEYAKKLSYLMSNDEVVNRLALNAIEKSKKFSMELIGERWIDIMYNLINACN